MSRNLYTVAVVAPRIARELGRLNHEHRDDWNRGAGEHVLAVEATKTDSAVAYYRVVLDGWDHALSYLAQTRQFEASLALRSLCEHAASCGLAIIDPSSPLPRVRAPRATRLLNGYAIRALAAALDDASIHMAATNSPAVLLHRTLGPSIDDADFSEPPPRRSRYR